MCDFNKTGFYVVTQKQEVDIYQKAQKVLAFSKNFALSGFLYRSEPIFNQWITPVQLRSFQLGSYKEFILKNSDRDLRRRNQAKSYGGR